MKIKLLWVVSLLSVLSVLSVAPARADDPKKGEPKKVPFSMLPSQHIAVQVKVNGNGPYRLVFDTGAPMMLITNRLAKDAGVIKKDERPPGFGIFGAFDKQFTIKEFQMGDLKVENVETMIMDHPTVAQMEKLFGRIDGIVGFPFFARYRMTLDYQAKEMTFVPTDYKPTNFLQSLMKMMNSMAQNPDVLNAPKFLAPPAAWGFSADKGTTDENAGVEVNEVLKDSPAAKAGLEIGDRLLTIDGRLTDSVIDLFEAASHVKPGQTVPLQIERKGKKMELKATPSKGL